MGLCRQDRARTRLITGPWWALPRSRSLFCVRLFAPLKIQCFFWPKMIISIVFHLQDKVQSDVWLSRRQDGELTMFSLYFGKTQGETISQNYHYCCKNGLQLVALLPRLLMDSANKPDTQRCFMESQPCCSPNMWINLPWSELRKTFFS